MRRSIFGFLVLLLVTGLLTGTQFAADFNCLESSRFECTAAPMKMSVANSNANTASARFTVAQIPCTSIGAVQQVPAASVETSATRPAPSVLAQVRQPPTISRDRNTDRCEYRSQGREFRPHPACGFNDAGVPNTGIFICHIGRRTDGTCGTVCSFAGCHRV